MTQSQKAQRSVLGGILIAALALLFVSTPAFFVHADARDDARSLVRAPSPVVVPPPPVIELPPPPTQSGDITSETSGSVSTGDNQGGTVVTGDASVEVHQTNIGPTNPSSSTNVDVSTSPPPPPPPSCVNDRRAPNACPIDTSYRAR